MAIRVTPQHFANNTVRYSQGHSQNLERLQTQISSGIKIHKPSDAPGMMSSLIAKKSSIARVEIDLTNIEIVRGRLNQSFSSLSTAINAITRAKSLALTAVQQSSDERAVTAREVNGVLDLVLKMANATDGSKPLYAGTAKTLKPFEVTQRGDEGIPQVVEYGGSQERARVVVGIVTAYDALYTGEEVFMEDQRTHTEFFGKTGAVPGTGTDNAVGQGQLVVTRTSTTILGSSGLTPGDSSADDTLIGMHTIRVDNAAQTLSLSDGAAVPFTPGDTDVQVISPDGAIIHLNTAALNPGFNGSIQVTAEGTLSTDGGATEVAIDFSDNQAVVDSRTGKVTYVDSRDINQAGNEHVEYVGSSSVFQVLMQLRDDLTNSQDMSASDLNRLLNIRIGELNRIHAHLTEVRGEQSVALANLDAFQEQTEEYRLETQGIVNELEATDFADAIVKMQTEQNALQYTYAISAQLMQLSILDFL